ncbi:MAG: MaoC family dehydratase N-terminal domain-containing protein [Deltaproteobacteria bacterium]|nr:MaoC family dehydratase N-terminal domain-containing protein [Deltaproteobacteria bacterium]
MRYSDDFQLGERILTRSRTVTEADIVMFAAFSGDWHPLHVDEEYARKGFFGQRIAHGFLVLSVATGLMGLADMAILAFYGMDRVRFMAPTKIGDTLRAEMEVAEKVDRNEKEGIVTLKVTVINQRDEAVASMGMKLLMARN